MPQPATPEPKVNLWQAAYRAMRKLGDERATDLDLDLDLLEDEDFVRDEPERPN